MSESAELSFEREIRKIVRDELVRLLAEREEEVNSDWESIPRNSVVTNRTDAARAIIDALEPTTKKKGISTLEMLSRKDLYQAIEKLCPDLGDKVPSPKSLGKRLASIRGITLEDGRRLDRYSVHNTFHWRVTK